MKDQTHDEHDRRGTKRATEESAGRARFLRADDGIRTRDPHLGKVAKMAPRPAAERGNVL